MNMFLYDLKQGKKLVIWGLVAFIAFCTIAVAATVVWVRLANPNQNFLGEDGVPRVPLSTYGQATIESFTCLSQGDDCPTFDDTVSALATDSQEFTYTPTDDAAPGTSSSNGERVVTLDEGLSDAEWQALGASVVRDGAVQVDDVSRENLYLEDGVGHFAVEPSDGSPALRGEMVFEFSGSQDNPQNVSISAVTYEEGE